MADNDNGQILILSEDYKNWVESISLRYRQCQIKAAFFVKKTIQNNWSRAVLENFLDTDLYERQGKAITNFAYSLPAPQSDLAQEMTKDPYNFDFLTMIFCFTIFGFTAMWLWK